MPRSDKLYSALLANPRRPFPFRDFVQLLLAFGFTLDRTVGSHRQYRHPKVPRTLPVQPTGKDAKLYQVRQFLDMIEEYQLDLE